MKKAENKDNSNVWQNQSVKQRTAWQIDAFCEHGNEQWGSIGNRIILKTSNWTGLLRRFQNQVPLVLRQVPDDSCLFSSPNDQIFAHRRRFQIG
jgi:hypothetical protein